jgi:hypothetical protein
MRELDFEKETLADIERGIIAIIKETIDAVTDISASDPYFDPEDVSYLFEEMINEVGIELDTYKELAREWKSEDPMSEEDFH